MAMDNSKVVYSSTSDFLKYISARTKEKEKPSNKFSVNKEYKNRNDGYYSQERYN